MKNRTCYLISLVAAIAALILINLITPTLLRPLFVIIATIIVVTLIYKLFVLCDSFEKFRAETKERLDKITGGSGN